VNALGQEVCAVQVQAPIVLVNRGHHVDAHAKVESRVDTILLVTEGGRNPPACTAVIGGPTC
jgi:hypothetical protein